MGDLDLLVSPAHLERAQAALERAGYRTVGTEAMIEAYRLYHFDMPLAHANGFVVGAGSRPPRTALAERSDRQRGCPVVDGLAPSCLSRLNLTLLRPLSWVISEPGRRSAAAGEVLLFWITVGWRNRLRRYLVVAWPEADPLAWMWERPAQDWRQPRRVWPLAKLLGYQMLVYARGLAGALTASGRRRLRFWT